MPSAGRASLPTTRPKSWRLQRPHDKGNIARHDQEKYQKKLLKAVQSFVVGGNQPNLDIIAISFEHKCFSEARNRTEYRSKIHAKLREWNYDDISSDESSPPLPPLPSSSSNHPHPPMAPLSSASSVTIPSPSPSCTSSSSDLDIVMHGPPPHPPQTAAATAAAAAAHVKQRQKPKRQQPEFLNLFDPALLDKIDLNDPESRNRWVTAVWEYFTMGGRWDGVSAGVGCGRAGSGGAGDVMDEGEDGGVRGGNGRW